MQLGNTEVDVLSTRSLLTSRIRTILVSMNNNLDDRSVVPEQLFECSGCGAKVSLDDMFCNKCGSEIEDQPYQCNECGAAVWPDGNGCPNCGNRVLGVMREDGAESRSTEVGANSRQLPGPLGGEIMTDASQLKDEELAQELRNRRYKAQIDSLTTRYRDAYLVARATNGIGTNIKGFGMLGLIVFCFFGFMLASKNGPQQPMGMIGVALIAVGVIFGILFYVVGVLIATQGQVLKASLDSAVNTSPFLASEHRTKIMSL